MPRSQLIASFILAGALPLAAASATTPSAAPDGRGAITLPGAVATEPLKEAVLFGFDDYAFPFRNHVETHLHNPHKMEMVVQPGAPGTYDGSILYYGTVIKINGSYHMWYIGNYGAERPLLGFELHDCCLCYATSPDGIHWEKPNLGLVDFGGNRNNNVTDFPDHTIWSTCAMIYEPNDPDPSRRYKMAYEAHRPTPHSLSCCVAFSPDGLHWHGSAANPMPMFLEMTGVTKWNGLYYVCGQAGLDAHHKTYARRLCTYVSADFEHWSPCSACGLDRSPDLTGPSMEDRMHEYEEIHLGAGLWNRGNVIVGIYGMWHGDRSGDRHMLVMDLGLAISHDALHYSEPIPNFRLILAREQEGAPLGEGPTLVQGQGMDNQGDETLYWYSLWRGRVGSGVRVAIWPRDRLGSLRPFNPHAAQAISCPIEAADDSGRVYLNVDGLGPNSFLHVGLLDNGFRPVAGFSGADDAVINQNGLHVPVTWKGGASVPAGRKVRLDIRFEGVRPEDASLYAAYVGGSDHKSR